MVAVGLVEQVPIFWIMGALPLVLAAFFTLFLRVGQWRERKDPRNKFKFVSPHLGTQFLPKQQNEVPRVSILQLGTVMRNDASFPISLIFENAETSIGRLRPPRGAFPRPPRRVDPGEVVASVDDPIAMNGTPCGQRLFGHMHIKVRYGYPGKEIYPLEIMGSVEIELTEDGKVHLSFARDVMPGGTANAA